MRDQREEKRKSERYKAKRFLSTHEGSGCGRVQIWTGLGVESPNSMEKKPKFA